MNQPPSHPFRTLYCVHCGKVRYVPASCGDRFCEVCNWRAQRRARVRIAHACKNHPKTRGFHLSHIVLTIESQADLYQMARDLLRKFRAYRQRKVWHYHVKGGAYTIEITGTPGRWHAHLHIVAHCRYFPQHQISRSWRAATGSPVVYITRIPGNVAARYLTKYITKTEVRLEDHVTVSRALHGIRLYSLFGDWHGLDRGIDPVPRHPLVCPDCGHSDWIAESDVVFRHLRSDGSTSPP